MPTLIAEQLIPASPETCWDFFSSPTNLNKIKPADMLFQIKSELPAKLYPGLLIQYRVAPVARIPFCWLSEITRVREGAFFIDEQRVGPFRIWHHEHHFFPSGEHTLMRDVLHYEIGNGLLGKLAGLIFVHRKVDSIFRFRKQMIAHLFPEPKQS